MRVEVFSDPPWELAADVTSVVELSAEGVDFSVAMPYLVIQETPKTAM